jgi:hypothetical protein
MIRQIAQIRDDLLLVKKKDGVGLMAAPKDGS